MSRWLALADAAPYRAAGKPVWAVALSFNGRTRQFKGGLRTSSRLETVGGMWYHIGDFRKGALSPLNGNGRSFDMELPPFGKPLCIAEDNCSRDQGGVSMPCHRHARKLHEGGAGMKEKEEDPIMDEVYAVRHEISSRFGNDPKRYIESIREMKRRAGEVGLSFLEYCRSNVGTDALFPV